METSKVYTQLKYLKQEERVGKLNEKSQDKPEHRQTLKYNALLQRLHDICLVKMLINQSELIDPAEPNQDQQKFQYKHHKDKIKHRIANYILDNDQNNRASQSTPKSIKPAQNKVP